MSPDLRSEDLAWEMIMAKASIHRRALVSYRRLLRLNERKLTPPLNEWLEWTAKKLRAGLDNIHGKTPAAKAKSIADWDEIKERGAELIKPVLFEILEAGGNSVMTQRRLKKQTICFDPFEIRRTWEIEKQERFDPIGVEAVKWAESHSAELVVQITDETMLAIRAYITQGIKEGKSIQKIAMELRPLVGLTEKQIMAVANYHEMLILERPEYTAATQSEMAEVYARRLHRQRASLIATTETRAALWEGAFEGYDQMGLDNVEGVSDPEACDWCKDNIDGKVYSIEEARSVAADAHPGCECGWVAVV